MDLRFVLLLACFFLSGFAALLYQTAWTRELSFVFGTSELAVAAVLAAYMGGLALGAAAAARIAVRMRRPVLVYGLLELAIAGCALVVPWAIRGATALYVAWLGGAGDLPESHSAVAALFQLAAAFAVLMPPTAFMGATLPLLARHAVRREEEIASRVGVLYAVNTAGAIAGTVAAAFLLMPELGLRRTVWTGAGVNALVFGLATLLARSAPLPTTAEAAPTRAPAAPGASWILPAMALSGAVSFAYEVLWTRLLGHLLGGSVAAFATMLASFLLGIALGSAVAARLAVSRQRAAIGFSLSQLGIASTLYAAFALSDRLPELSAGLSAGPNAPLASAAVAAAALLPITLCIGATFPFAVRMLALHPEQAARATARVYAWNTVGAIAGALGAGFVLLPGVGFEGTAMVGIAANLALAAWAALAAPSRRLVPAAVAAIGGLALVLAPASPPWTLLTSSPMRKAPWEGEVVYAAVGRSATVLVMERRGRFQLSTNGLPEAAVDAKGMLPGINIAEWLGVLPALVRPGAREMLVVGLGGGGALEFAPSSLETIDVIELEPEVLAANRHIAAQRSRDPLADPRVRVHIGDARGTLQLTENRWDAIVSQPSHPWTAGASHLYTREFFELVRTRLEPDGVFVQWIGTRFVDEALFRTLLATLLEVFPHVELYRPRLNGLLFVSSGAPIDGLAGARRALRAAPGDFAWLGLHRIEDFASAWVLGEEGVRALAQGAPPNTDDHNRLAARSAQVGADALDGGKAASVLLDPYDPLVHVTDLDHSAVIRSLIDLSQLDRATDLALAAEGVREEAGLGWVELAKMRTARAARHFERALSLAPADDDARMGWLLAHKHELSNGAVEVPFDLDAPRAAVVAAWGHAGSGEWGGVARLDAALAAFEPGSPLFEEATRLRIRARLSQDDPGLAAEAEALAVTLLLRHWHPYEALLLARAANRAGHPRMAIGALARVADTAARNQRGRVLLERALEIAEGIPGEDADRLRVEFTRRAGLGSSAR